MSRRRRPYLPGAIFHVTSRTQGREAWFTEPLRTLMVSFVREGIASTGAWLLAYAIMPNHLHLILRQGPESLGEVLQPVLRRIAILVQRTGGRDGHVFERRYRAHPCPDADYVRSAIVYTHLNPVRAGLCEDPLDYPWTSHRAYASRGRDSGASTHHVELALRLFASDQSASLAAARRDYGRFVRWRIEADRWRSLADAGRAEGIAPTPPATVAGDELWRTFFSPATPAYDPRRDGGAEPGNNGSADVLDLRDIAREVLSQQGHGLTLEWVRGPGKCPAQVNARRAIIRRAAAAGYRRSRVAKFLGVSPAAITRALSSHSSPPAPSPD
ncbi:MAG TPA: transposase [Longimicrobiales bacterium]